VPVVDPVVEAPEEVAEVDLLGERIRAPRIDAVAAGRRGHAVDGLREDAEGGRIAGTTEVPGRGASLQLAGEEEVQPVPDDGPAERKAVLPVGEVGGWIEGTPVAAQRLIADEALVAVVDEGRALQLVGPALGDRVDETAGEARLADVEGRDQHLELVDRVERDRLGGGALPAGGAAGAEAEDVARRRPVDLDVVESVVRASHRRG